MAFGVIEIHSHGRKIKTSHLHESPSATDRIVEANTAYRVVEGRNSGRRRHFGQVLEDAVRPANTKSRESQITFTKLVYVDSLCSVIPKTAPLLAW